MASSESLAGPASAPPEQVPWLIWANGWQSSPVVGELRHCRSEALRKQLKALLAAVEQSSQEVQRFREQLQDHVRGY